MDEPAFPTYVGQVLVPDLRTNDVMVLDNLPAHKVAGVRDAIRRLERLYLPPYSPDLNPIKQLGAKINTLLALAQLAPPPSARSQAR